MTNLLSINWQQLFIPSNSILEIILRGTVTYLSIFIFLRVISKREQGQLGTADILVIVMLADAAQNSMAGEYKSITEGLILVLTIISWSYFLDWLAFKSKFFNKLISPKKSLLIENGVLNKRNLRREFMTKEDLLSEVRLKGGESFDEVKKCFMEPDGEVSVIFKKKK